MTLAEKIYQESKALPDELAREVLDFIGFIEQKYRLESAQQRDLKAAQQLSLSKVWDNAIDDETWNDL